MVDESAEAVRELNADSRFLQVLKCSVDRFLIIISEEIKERAAAHNLSYSLLHLPF
jgi:hypothetical protein